MSTTEDRPTIQELVTRLAELEQAHAYLQEELTNLRAERMSAEEQARLQTRARPRRSSRRKMLTKGLGVAAATVGAGALLELGSGAAAASGGAKPGVFASSTAGTPAVSATGTNGAHGVDATSDSGTGVSASSTSGTGLVATSSTGLAAHFVGGNVNMDKNLTVAGTLSSGVASFTSSGGQAAVFAQSTSADGVFGRSTSGFGVHGQSTSSSAVMGTSTGTGLAGEFAGNVSISGNLMVSGTLSKGAGSFRIDHPLDPAHRYLSHSFVESPDMKNIYDGMVTLDANGEAEVTLPSWFGALNTEFRYQLTCIGGYAPVYIAEEISANHFKIAGGQAGMEVCWQVSGIRQDAWANAYRIPVEEDKPASEQGFYLHPELYGQSEQQRVVRIWHPEPSLPSGSR